MAVRQVHRPGTRKVTPRTDTKTAVEFGQTVTLYRIVGENGKGTCWYASLDRAWKVWNRSHA